MASSICIEPGCSQPRHKAHTRCQEHQREYWRERQRASKSMDAAPRKSRISNVCHLCHRTAAEAALFAARGIACTGCNVVPAAVKPAKIIAEKTGQPALLVDAERSVLAQVHISVIDEQPLPGAADLRQRLLDAATTGLPVVRRHRFTGGGDDT